MKILITGGTGLIGRALCRSLVSKNHELTVITRNIDRARELLGSPVNLSNNIKEAMSGMDAVVNLAGENVGKGRWTEKKKAEIEKSRLKMAVSVVNAIEMARIRPQILIQASATGFYGSQGDKLLTESSAMGYGFLPSLAKRWEESSKGVRDWGVRRVVLRIAPVLTQDGGMLPKVAKPFQYFVGGVVGSGEEWFSWVHLEDVVRAIEYGLEQNRLSGIFNVSTPHPVQTKEFYKSVGRHLKRPCWLRTPKLLLKILLGEKVNELIFSSARILPERLLQEGFKFKYGKLEDALKKIYF